MIRPLYFTLGAISFFQVASNLLYVFAINDGHHNALKAATLLLFNVFDNGPCYALYAVNLALEGCHSLLESALFKFFALCVYKLVF